MVIPSSPFNPTPVMTPAAKPIPNPILTPSSALWTGSNDSRFFLLVGNHLFRAGALVAIRCDLHDLIIFCSISGWVYLDNVDESFGERSRTCLWI
mmetsp:Transcript_24798/g.36750  ORF Transcript_24798/g.36750 Transcript_24798/m.36750 type:complete len:95 (+) Transcript_24798:647-931(+)